MKSIEEDGAANKPHKIRIKYVGAGIAITGIIGAVGCIAGGLTVRSSAWDHFERVKTTVGAALKNDSAHKEHTVEKGKKFSDCDSISCVYISVEVLRPNGADIQGEVRPQPWLSWLPYSTPEEFGTRQIKRYVSAVSIVPN